MTLRAALACLVLFGSAACGGATVSIADDAGAAKDAARDALPKDPPPPPPLLLPDSGGPTPFLVGDGTCSVTAVVVPDGGAPDAGPPSESGTATSAFASLGEDISARKITCVTPHQTVSVTAPDFLSGPEPGVVQLQTYWGLEGTGTGKGPCTVTFQPNTRWIGTFQCPPVVMSWGASVAVSGSFSAK